MLASIMYKVYNNTLPERLTSLLGIRNTVNKNNLRRMNNFSITRYNSELGRNRVSYGGPIDGVYDEKCVCYAQVAASLCHI